MSDIRLLIVDDNVQMRAAMQAYFTRAERTIPIGAAGDGEEALALTLALRPDVVLLDIVMPVLDGFGYLERLRGYPDVRPNIIVLSAIARDELIGRAVDMGACFYMLKPVNYDVLYQRILYHSGAEVFEQAQVPVPMPVVPVLPALDDEIEGALRLIGVPPHVQGYAFVLEAVKRVVLDPGLINRITKELYPVVAKHFLTTPIKVERSIRHAIEVTWSRQSTSQINASIGRSVFSSWGRPSNGEFIACVSGIVPRGAK